MFYSLQFLFALIDVGCDYETNYKQVYQMKGFSIIAYNKSNVSDNLDEHFEPTCIKEHSYRYDRFDINIKP